MYQLNVIFIIFKLVTNELENQNFIPPKVVLDKEGGIKLSDGDLVGVSGWWDDLIEEFGRGSLPNLLDDSPELCVTVVYVTC